MWRKLFAHITTFVCVCVCGRDTISNHSSLQMGNCSKYQMRKISQPRFRGRSSRSKISVLSIVLISIHGVAKSRTRLSDWTELNWNFMCVCVCYSLSHVWLFVTPWIVAHQTPLSMGFSRQEYRSVLPFPSPGDLSYPGSPTL